MAEKPILFNTEMVKAILDGRKTQTRRVIRFPEGTTGRLPEGGARDYVYYLGGIKRPPYQPGDILWVRETWAKMPYGYVYRADDEAPEGWDSADRWRPSIHMPRKAARLFLLVENVRIERLQDMTDDDAVAEGFSGLMTPPLAWFADLWSRTVKPADLPRYGWSANPWVWVIEFERLTEAG